MPFKVGDRVKWTSGAAGTIREKVGTVKIIVPIDEFVSRIGVGIGSQMIDLAEVDPQFDGGIRKHESYLVEVARGAKAKPALYWPVVSKLRLVELELQGHFEQTEPTE